MRAPRRGVSPARRCAYAVVRRVFEAGAYADRALHAEAAGLHPRERALATNLAYGTVQRRATLDHVAERLCDRPLRSLEPAVLAALRLGLFQILLLDGIAEHAAVNESVELVKPGAPGGAGLLNAVLRRATREGREVVAELDDATPERAAVLHSVPRWLAEMWWRELGDDDARRLLVAINRPAESALRLNPLRGDLREIADALPVAVEAVAGVPEAVVCQGPFDAHGSAAFARGELMPQSRGSIAVGRALAPVAGERVLDLCAAPGAKTTHLAALMGDRGELVAVERHPGRASALRRTIERMGAGIASVRCVDARETVNGGLFDRVLVDPPCTGLGTVQSRPDLRWRVRPESVAELTALQGELLDAAAARCSGTLVYSVCTISDAEGPAQLASFLERHPEFAPDSDGGPATVQLRPDRDGTDGFFIARLRRA